MTDPVAVKTPETLRVLADHAVIFADGSHCCVMHGMGIGHDEDCPAGKLYAHAAAWEADREAYRLLSMNLGGQITDLHKQVEALERAVAFYADLAPAPGE
jgi:hypothetical protein